MLRNCLILKMLLRRNHISPIINAVELIKLPKSGFAPNIKRLLTISKLPFCEA